MKKTIYIIGLLSISVLTGCSSGSHSDLNDWMTDQRNSQKGKIEPLPAARTFVPVAFSSKDDPFKERPIISLNDLDKNKLAPDASRRKEPLEMYSLEQLKITGTLSKDNVMYAMIKTPDGSINYVTRGNYMGSNYGQIVSMSEVHLELNERIKESDEWKIKTNRISLE